METGEIGGRIYIDKIDMKERRQETNGQGNHRNNNRDNAAQPERALRLQSGWFLSHVIEGNLGCEIIVWR